MGKLNGYIKSTGHSTDCLHWAPLNWEYLFRINPWNRAHIRPKTRLKFLHMHLRFTRNNGIKYTCTDTRGCKQFYSSMCSTVLTVYVSMLSIRLLLVAKDFNRFCWLDFHSQTRLYGNWKFFQQICAVTKSIKTRILFIMCSLCHLLLLLYFVHLTIKLFILSFCMASPSFHTCEKLSFHYTLCSLSVCVRVRGAHMRLQTFIHIYCTIYKWAAGLLVFFGFVVSIDTEYWIFCTIKCTMKRIYVCSLSNRYHNWVTV